MDRGTKLILEKILILIIAIIIAAIVVFGLASIVIQLEAEYQCEKLEGYGFVVEVREASWLNYKCYIKMDDGVWIQSSDFDITAIKTPARKR